MVVCLFELKEEDDGMRNDGNEGTGEARGEERRGENRMLFAISWKWSEYIIKTEG